MIYLHMMFLWVIFLEAGVGVRTVGNKTLTGKLGFGFMVPRPGKPGLSHFKK